MTRSPSDLPQLRRDYPGAPLGEGEADPDPFRQFDIWFEEIRKTERDPTAMALATATRDGRPSVRMVLLKGADSRGFVFYTNYRSRKGQEIGQTRHASLLFYWASLDRQVRIEGTVSAVGAEDSDAYFSSRPLESRLSASASAQSEVVESREVLEAAVAHLRERHGETVPRPEWWGGYRVTPTQFEFWQGRPNRLHDRLRYRRPAPGSETWLIERLSP